MRTLAREGCCVGLGAVTRPYTCTWPLVAVFHQRPVHKARNTCYHPAHLLFHACTFSIQRALACMDNHLVLFEGMRLAQGCPRPSSVARMLATEMFVCVCRRLTTTIVQRRALKDLGLRHGPSPRKVHCANVSV